VASDDLVAVPHQSEEHPFCSTSTATIVSVGRDARHGSPALTMATRTGILRLSSALSRRGPFENSRVGLIRTESDIPKRLVDLPAEALAAATSRRHRGEVAERAALGCKAVRNGTVRQRA
jgi:hypothetical protein